VQNSVFRNNLLYENIASGMSFYMIDAAAPAKNNLVVNNTIVQYDTSRWAINIADSSTGIVIHNNILLNRGGRGAISIGPESMTGFLSDYNVLKDVMSADGGNAFINFAAWKTQTSQDAHSVVATEALVFANAATDDYHLKAGSPAVNLGTSVNAPGLDLAGVVRPQGGAVDAGAYELPGVSVEGNAGVTIDKAGILISPNPFTPKTQILIPGIASQIGTRLKIYSASGRLVADLSGKASLSGIIEWNAAGFPAGIYLVRLSANGTTCQTKAILAR